MSLINPTILFGLGLAAIPILLHFLMRAKPKKLLFPALRLIQVRRKTNVRRLRLRHIWLLLLRILVIALIVLAIARPSVPAANYSPTTREILTITVIIALAAGAYWGVLHLWRKQRTPHHVFAYRRSLLRGGTAIAALVLFLLLVAWPYQRRIAAELSGPRPDVAQNLPVAGVFLFDTSVSMEYRLESKTRLERAVEIASDRLENLPAQSRIAVADTATDAAILFQADLQSAQKRIDSLKTHPAAVSLNDRLRAALSLQEEDVRRTMEADASVPADQRRDRYLREIYLFTDLSKSAWQMAGAKFLRDEIARLPWIHVYIIDVGVENPTNTAVTSLRLSKQTIPLGGELIVEAMLDAAGLPDAERTAELYVRNEAGSLVKKGQTTLKIDGNTGARALFSVPGLTGPLVQGEVRLIASDPLPADDVRYFTATVKPPPEILVVSPSRSDAAYWLDALAPPELVKLGKARYRCTWIPAARLANTDLSKYESVCLLNIPVVPENIWNKLAAYVEQGGGLALFLGMPNRGDTLPPVSYNSQAAQSFLPAELLAELQFTPPEYFDVRNLAHPMFRKFEELGGVGELTSSEVRRYWRVKPTGNASVVATYTDTRNSPAIVDRVHGRGRVVMLTTAVDLNAGWSDLPLARWSWVAFADQMMQYLAQRSERIYNFPAGGDIILSLDRGQAPPRYLLRTPGLKQLPGELPRDADTLVINTTDQLGHYQVVAADPDSKFHTGFSVNLAEGESDFTRVVPADLDLLLGEKRYSLAREIDELERVVTSVQLGQELFPYVLLFLLAAFCTEHLVANRFYEADQAATHI